MGGARPESTRPCNTAGLACLADERRAQHDAIHEQPQAFRDAIRNSGATAEAFAAGIAPAGRTFLVGTGTSLHAAMVGEHLFRLYGGGRLALAVPAFDFALYGPDLRPSDTVVVLSHRGTKRYSLESLGRAAAAGCHTALVCGEGAPAPPVAPDAVLPTVPQEASSAHTVSYTGSIAILSAMAAAVGRRFSEDRLGTPGPLDAEIPERLEQSLLLEPMAEALARRHADHRRIWIAGAGPDAVTALEVALKIKETSYLQAEGMAVEAMLHGPLQCAESEDLFVLIATATPGAERLRSLDYMVQEIGAARLWVGDAAPTSEGGASTLVVPAVPAPFSCLTGLIPLQLLAYHLAVLRGTNPDGFRLDDPRFARVARHARL